METDKKKIVVIAVLLVSAGTVTYFSIGKGDDEEVFNEKQAMLCVNPKCGKDFELTLGQIRQETDNLDAMQSLGPPVFVCPFCNQKSAYTAEKCSFCGTVFIPNPTVRDFHDRCPQCGKSETEEKRKRSQP